MNSTEVSESKADTQEHVDLEDYILEYLETHDTIQPSDIVDNIAQARQTISTHMMGMGKSGLLEKVPSKRRGYVIWRLPPSPWEGSLTRRRDEFKKDLDAFPYVPLYCSVDENTMLLEDAFGRWQETDSRLFVLLGNYGNGKTSFSKKVYCKLVDRYLAYPDEERIPIYVRLRSFTPLDNSLINMAGKWYPHKHLPSNEEVIRLNKEGRILLILDGFDEMPSKTGKLFPKSNFEFFSELFTSDCKVMLTSRTAYFTKRLEEERVCTPQDQSFTGFLLESEAETQRAYILDFRPEDIDTYLRLYFGKHWKRKKKKMDGIYDLSDLAKRPILLNVICQTLPCLNYTEDKIGPIDIYHEYTRMWIEREKWKDINEEDIKRFMMELALDMSKNGYSEIHYKDLRKRISKSLSDRIFSYYELDDFDSKIRTCTFLHRDDEGNYSFMHKSFMEYFVAMGIQEAFETTRDAEQIQKILRGVDLRAPVDQFICSLLLECPNCGKQMEYRSSGEQWTGFRCSSCKSVIALEETTIGA